MLVLLIAGLAAYWLYASFTGEAGALSVLPPVTIVLGGGTEDTIAAGEMSTFTWQAPGNRPNCHLQGKIEVVSGGNRDVQVLVAKEDDYKNLINGHRGRTFLDTDRQTVIPLDIRIAERGRMVLAVSNRFSVLTSKLVRYHAVHVECQ